MYDEMHTHPFHGQADTLLSFFTSFGFFKAGLALPIYPNSSCQFLLHISGAWLYLILDGAHRLGRFWLIERVWRWRVYKI